MAIFLKNKLFIEIRQFSSILAKHRSIFNCAMTLFEVGGGGKLHLFEILPLKIEIQRGGSIWLYDPNPGTRGERPKFFLVFGDFMTQKCGPKYEISLKNLTLWPKNTQNVGFCAGMSCNPNPDKFVSISTKNFQKIWSKTKIRRSKNKVENRLFSSGGVKCDFMTQIPEQGGVKIGS